MKIIFTDNASDSWENTGYQIQEFFAFLFFCTLLLQARRFPFLTHTNIAGYEAKAFEEKLS